MLYYCLIVISPPNKLSWEVSGIKREFLLKHGEYGGHWSKPHITLNRDLLLCSRLTTFLSQLRSALCNFYTFDLHLDGFDFFPESQTFYLRPVHNESLYRLQRLVTCVLRRIKPDSDGRKYSFNPHLTIGRTLSKSQFNYAFYEYQDRKFSEYFRVNDVTVLFQRIGDSKYRSCNIDLKDESWALIY